MQPAQPHRLLIVEDDPLFARTLRLQLGAGPFHLTFCAHTAQALAALQEEAVDLVLLDIHLGGHEEGLTALPKLIAAAPDVPVVVHSVLSDHATVVRAMRQGAHDYIPKHVGIKTLGPQLLSIIARYREEAEPAAQAVAANTPGRPGASRAVASGPSGTMLGRSPAMGVLHRSIAQAKRSRGSVIVLGEPGSGKELVARALSRPGAPFIAVDASTLEGNLATGLLFGHERGAFTGADASRPGLFEQAHGGVLYFDEVANMTLDVQAKLLRVLQEREVTRLGGTKPRPLTFRLICATHADLPAMCRQGQFRFDLLTRLQVFVLQVPPLRQRLDDVHVLFEAFVHRFCYENAVPTLRVDATTLTALRQRMWPGNVRQLQHAAQYAVAACQGNVVMPQHLPSPSDLDAECLAHHRPVAPAQADPHPEPQAYVAKTPVPHASSFSARVRAFERSTLAQAYAASDGNISALARGLGMDRSSLYAKLRLYGIYPAKNS